MANFEDLAIPKGSTVLVTGVNGFMASHVADKFVQHGYKVRGTVRNTEKSAWLDVYFDKTYGKGHLELYCVPDMTIENAYDEAVKGVSAFIHVASVVSIDPDPEKVIPTAVESAVLAIKAAYREPSIKRFVLTSSSAATLPVDVQTLLSMNGAVLTEDSWSPDAQALAWTPGPWGPEHGFSVYCASKVEQEQAVWKYQKENQTKRPDIIVNTEYAIDVQDAGLLHGAAAILPDVKSGGIFGFTQPFCWDDVLEILRKQNPNMTFQGGFADVPFPAIVIKPRDRAKELLERLGKPGFTSLADMVWQNTEDLRAADTI